jgi:hypothetical protein
LNLQTSAHPEFLHRNQPDERGHFGQFGGRYVAETLMPLILDLEKANIRAAKADPAFRPSSTICSNIMSAGPARSISPRADRGTWRRPQARKSGSSATS